MRAYSASSLEAVRARDLLKEWNREGFISEAQYRRMEPEIVCDLRRTNIFLRLVLILFTLIIAGAAVGMFLMARSTTQATGTFLLIFAAVSYAAAELAVSKTRLYRYGIEEALAACSVGFLCVGMQAALFSDHLYSSNPGRAEILVPAAGAILSLWIWHRFGLPYAALASMFFVIWLPAHRTSSHEARHLIVAAIYVAGLFSIVAIRRDYRLTYLNLEYSIAEALLWLGIYLAMNLQLSSLDLLGQWWGSPRVTAEFSRPFYWTTWVLTWCLPPMVLARGLRQKDRFVIAAGCIVSVLTLVTNKPYLGWPRHTWDLMLMGALLIGIALFIRRWLAAGPGEIRCGFTARRLSGKEKSWMNLASSSLGIATPSIIAPRPETGSSDFHFGGGDSGGGGASSEF